jgi:hypothetical protein
MSNEVKARIMLWLFILFLCALSFFAGRVARADGIDNFTLPDAGAPIPGILTWQMAADEGVIQPISWGGDVGYQVGTIVASYLGGTMYYELTFDASTSDLWMQYQGGAPNVPFAGQGGCADQSDWGSCFYAVYYGFGAGLPREPFRINGHGDFIFVPGTYGDLTISSRMVKKLKRAEIA